MKQRSLFELVVAIAIAALCSNFRAIAQDDMQTGQQAIDQGNFDGAIDFFSFKLSVDPKNAAAYNGRAMAYLRKGDVKNALSDFAEAIRLDPRFARAYAGRARLH